MNLSGLIEDLFYKNLFKYITSLNLEWFAPDFNKIINKNDLPSSVGHGKSLISKDIDH